MSVILQLKDGSEGLSSLMDDASELAAWTSASGVKILSIYERTGEQVPCVMHDLKLMKMRRQPKSKPTPSSPKNHSDADKLLRNQSCLETDHLTS